MQHLEAFREYCLSLKGVSESTPFGPDALVFKVMNKMFALTGLDSSEFKVNLKCDPELALQLREQFDYVMPGYHQNKKHWNTIDFKRATTLQKEDWTLHSYQLVVASFTKAEHSVYLTID